MKDPDTWKQTLIEVYRTQWSDIHHSRRQDWELSKIVLAGFIGLSGLEVFGKDVWLQRMLALVFVVLGIMAIAVTWRHKKLFEEKKKAILKLESELGVDELKLFELKKRRFPFLTSQNFLICIYVFSTMIFAVFLIRSLVH